MFLEFVWDSRSAPWLFPLFFLSLPLLFSLISSNKSSLAFTKVFSIGKLSGSWINRQVNLGTFQNEKGKRKGEREREEDKKHHYAISKPSRPWPEIWNTLKIVYERIPRMKVSLGKKDWKNSERERKKEEKEHFGQAENKA